MQSNYRRAEAGFGHHFRLRIVLFDRGVVRVDLGLRFRNRRARFQPRDHVGATAAGMALLRSAVRRPGSYWDKEARLPGEKAKIRRQDADDFSLDTVHTQI